MYEKWVYRNTNSQDGSRLHRHSLLTCPNYCRAVPKSRTSSRLEAKPYLFRRLSFLRSYNLTFSFARFPPRLASDLHHPKRVNFGTERCETKSCLDQATPCQWLLCIHISADKPYNTNNKQATNMGVTRCYGSIWASSQLRLISKILRTREPVKPDVCETGHPVYVNDILCLPRSN